MGHLPKPWRDARVVLIHKPDREPSLAKSYRPISLPSFMPKTLGKAYGRISKGGDLDKTPSTGIPAYL